MKLRHCGYQDQPAAANAAIAIMAKSHTSMDAAEPLSLLKRMASVPVATATLPPATSRSILFTLIRIRPGLGMANGAPWPITMIFQAGASSRRQVESAAVSNLRPRRSTVGVEVKHEVRVAVLRR